jgi:hypothetical protein
MKIQNLTWKDKVWVSGLLLASLFVLTMFSIQAVKDFSKDLVIGYGPNKVIVTTDQIHLK